MSSAMSDPSMVVKSLLETGLKFTANQDGEAPSAIADAGQFVLDNWAPLASASQALVRRKTGGDRGVQGVALPALGLGLAAGVAKLGLSLLQRRLQTRGGRRQDSERDSLRGVSSKSKTLKKYHRVPAQGSRAPNGPAAVRTPDPVSTPAPLQQLTMMFPSLDRCLLGDMLASNQGSLEITIDQLLAINIESTTPTPGPGHVRNNFQFPVSQPSSLPPCPDCPVCMTSLSSKRIYQCANGHHVCQECKRNPQLKVCPTCRQKLVGRATNMEQFLASLYGGHK